MRKFILSLCLVALGSTAVAETLFPMFVDVVGNYSDKAPAAEIAHLDLTYWGTSAYFKNAHEAAAFLNDVLPKDGFTCKEAALPGGKMTVYEAPMGETLLSDPQMSTIMLITLDDGRFLVGYREAK